MSVVEEHMEILVHCGVHGRVAVNLAEVAMKHNIELYISSDSKQVNCNSILELLSLALVQGSEICVRAEGEQAENALQVVRTLLMGDKQPDGT